MATSPQRPSPSLRPAQIDHWLETITRKRVQVQLHATEPQGCPQAEALWQMAALLEEAVEYVRVLRAALGTERPSVQEPAPALHRSLVLRRLL